MSTEEHADHTDTVPDMGKYMLATEGGQASAANADGASGTQQVVTKLLVTNPIAGSVIGKAGANIEQLQRSSGARIQLSRAGEFYPDHGVHVQCDGVIMAAGTSDRVLLLSGSLHSVLTAVFLILEKVARDSVVGKGKAPIGRGKEEREDEIKLALSRRLCGLLIGHKGQTVRDFITDSGANIRVQSLGELTPSDPERTISISGARDQVLRAVALVLNTLSMHEQFPSYMETTLQLATNQGVVLPPRSSAAKSVLSTARAALTLWLADDDVGAILGRKGQNLVDIQQSARVTIKISDRSKMDPTTNEREVSIAGTYSAVKLAEAMIAEKLNQSRARNASREEGVVHEDY